MRNQADLPSREPLMMQRGNLSEVSQIPVDRPFGVVGLLFNLGEGIHLEVQIEDLRLMRESRAHVVFRPACHDEIPVALQLLNVAFHRRRTAG